MHTPNDTDTSTPQALLRFLLSKKPMFHGREDAGSRNYSLSPLVLEWIADNTPSGGYTLETGCGYSTVIFSSIGKKHICVSPFSEEHEKIREWCLAHEFPVSNTDFAALASQDFLPSADLPDLDVILIDGDHAFPAPFIDWYYTADKLKKNGYLILDDTQLKTCEILAEFLGSENHQWEHTHTLGRTIIFRKTTDLPVAKGIQWVNQQYCTNSTRKKRFSWFGLRK